MLSNRTWALCKITCDIMCKISHFLHKVKHWISLSSVCKKVDFYTATEEIAKFIPGHPTILTTVLLCYLRETKIYQNEYCRKINKLLLLQCTNLSVSKDGAIRCLTLCEKFVILHKLSYKGPTSGYLTLVV